MNRDDLKSRVSHAREVTLDDGTTYQLRKPKWKAVESVMACYPATPDKDLTYGEIMHAMTLAVAATLMLDDGQATYEDAEDAIAAVSYTHLTLPTICSV